MTMKIAGIISIIIAVIMIYAQFGGNKSAYTLYELRVASPDTVPLPQGWPPTLDKTYPDLNLIDQNSSFFKLSSLKGGVIVIIPIAMNNMHSVAFENVSQYGSFRNIPSAQNKKSIEQIIKKFTPTVKLPHVDLIFVHLLLFNEANTEASIQDAKQWAEHFKLRTHENHVVAVLAEKIPDYAAKQIIPGVQLIDKNFILRADSTGATPQQNLERILIPMIPLALGL